jgi:hypothetical protein
MIPGVLACLREEENSSNEQFEVEIPMDSPGNRYSRWLGRWKGSIFSSSHSIWCPLIQERAGEPGTDDGEEYEEGEGDLEDDEEEYEGDETDDDGTEEVWADVLVEEDVEVLDDDEEEDDDDDDDEKPLTFGDEILELRF